MNPEKASKHVVIVGGGFAGVACARELARHSDVRITLLDRNNFHQFQPLLYQVATSQLAAGDVGYSLRKIFAGCTNVDVKLAAVTAVDAAGKTAVAANGEAFRGDYLVLAAGSRANFFNTPGAEQHTFPMYSLHDAVRLRSRILQVFEDADRNPKLLDEGALNFVIVGAGPTGVETAGALAELIHGIMPREYKDLDVSAARIHLVDHGRTVLAPFSDRAHTYAENVLREAGVQLRLATGVKEVGPGHVLLSDGTTIKTRVVVWAGGLMAAPLAASLGLPQGHGGRIDVQPDLTVPGFPGIYVLGDFANMPGSAGRALPQLGSVAQQAGQWAAKNILADMAGQPRTAFLYHDKGFMAIITRTAAVAEIGAERHELHGFLAAAAWRGVHASLLSGVHNKIASFLNWTWAWFSKDRGPQLLDRTDLPRINWDDDLAAAGHQPASAAPTGQEERAIGHVKLTMLASTAPSSQSAPSALNLPESLSREYDVIIIGTGAGGGTLARHLAASGKRILLLERGDFLPREKENWDADAVFVKNRYVSPDTWYDDKAKPFQPGVHYFVGGATKMYGAALFRLRQQDFKELRHHDGTSPAWPIAYEDLEPYYTQAEKLYFVHGLRGADPTEPPASEPYPYPPVAHEPRIQELSDRLTKAGLHPFPAPCGLLLNEQQRNRSVCLKCDTCDGFPCLVHAKADAEVSGVLPALSCANVTLVTNAKVIRLNTSPTGREVTEVVVERAGQPLSFKGHIVVLSAGAANSAKILLQSANDQHPNGLANGSDQVGRNFMFHNSSAMVALSRQPNPTRFQKTLSINDFYFGADDFPFPLGNIQMIGKSQGPMFRDDAPRFAPGWTLDIMARHAVDFWLTTEDLPDPNNRITVTAEGSIQLSYTPNNQEATQRLLAKLKGLLEHLDCHPHLIPNNVYLSKSIPIAGVGHQAGTCRFGTDPRTSVLDVHCKAHELDNLYVVDTSFFVSIGAVNPSLTAIANALRVGDHLLERLH
jgi:NADH dehydrogenase FAD-containing subunit